jgi:HEAT repeat protein
MGLDQEIVDVYIDRAVEEFDANPLSTRMIRRFADCSPREFAAAAVRQLATSTQSNALNFLNLLMLRQQDVMLDYISDPNHAEEDSINLFQRATAVDRFFEMKLAHRLPDRRGGNSDDALRGPRAARALDILNRTSAGRRLLSTLGHLIDSTDAQTREKATLFIGRRMQSADWAERQLRQADERVRANAVESIWGLTTTSARILLEICVGDRSNRVKGNALVGLHLAGREGLGDALVAMAGDTRPRFRSTAAWTMGKIGDAEFEPYLLGLFKDEQEVRTAAMRSLIALWHTEAKTPEALAAMASGRIGLTEEDASQLLALAVEIMPVNQA